MGYVLAATGRRIRKEKISTLRIRSVIILCILTVLTLSARPIANWLSRFPNGAFRISYGKGVYSTCMDFRDPLKYKHESLRLLPEGEKYLWYSPHEGFSNQARELKNALQIAMLLNRTLILPPVTDHGEVKHGKCLKPRYPTQRRFKETSWSAVRNHIVNSRYVSTADIIDLSPISPRLVKTIDLRVFLALWCGLDVAPACAGARCRGFVTALPPSWGSIALCTRRLLPSSIGPPCLVYEVEDDCHTTVWTNGENPLTRNYLEHQLMQKMRNDPVMSKEKSSVTAGFDYERKIVRKDIVKTLGRGSEAGDYFLLSFGSLFSRMYERMELHVNIRAAVGDRITAAKLEAIQGGYSFTEEIMRGAKFLVQQKFAKRPYFCAHMKLGDGILDPNWVRTLSPLKKRLEKLTKKFPKVQKLQIFVMTDLAREKWKGTILAEIDSTFRYEVHTLDGHEDFIAQAAQQMMASEHGFSLGFTPDISSSEQVKKGSVNSTSPHNFFVPDVRLYLEQVICACASVGFLGTFRSTVSRNIDDFRSAGLCPT